MLAGPEEPEAGLPDARGISDPPELVRTERAAARHLEQRRRVGEVIAELADLLVEHPVPALVAHSDGRHAHRVRPPGAEHPAHRVRRVQEPGDSSAVAFQFSPPLYWYAS